MDKFFAENREKIASLKSDTLNQRQEAYETMYAEKTAAAKEILADLAGATNTKDEKIAENSAISVGRGRNSDLRNGTRQRGRRSRNYYGRSGESGRIRGIHDRKFREK